MRHIRICLVVLVLSACAGSTVLLEALTEAEANEIVLVLGKAGVDARKQRAEGGREVTYMVVASRADEVQALDILRANNLPKFKDPDLKTTFQESGLIPTATEEKAKFLLATQGEIAMTLKAIPRVLDARVHLSLPDPDVLRDRAEEKPVPTASVLIKFQSNGTPTPPVGVDDVQYLVANGVSSELKPKNVVVTMLPSALEDHGGEAGAALPPFQPKGFLSIRTDSEGARKLLIATIGAGGMVLLALLAAFVMFTRARAARVGAARLQRQLNQARNLPAAPGGAEPEPEA